MKHLIVRTCRSPEFWQFARFCISGSVAFTVDATLLELVIHYANMPAHLARCISAPIAMQVAYVLNLTFTFRHQEGFSFKTWWRFIAGNVTGAALNYATFVTVLYFFMNHASRLDRMIAIVAGTGIGLVFNYWANRRFVFAKVDKK